MLNFDRCEPSILALTARIVRALQRIAGLDPAIVMVIGAEGRNILHRGLGHTFALRSTTDLDIGIAIPEWEIHDRLTRQLSPIGHTGIRYIVEEIPVDIIPFGNVEDPEGVVSPARRVGGLSVLGFQEVFARAKPLTLAPGVTIRIPHPAGYAALKMWAWSDRSIDGEDRDASDLAICCYWYQESDTIADRLYDTDTGLQVLEENEWDVSLAATQLLGRDIAEQLGPQRAADLSQAWAQSDLDHLATRLGHDTIPTWPRDRARRKAIVARLSAGMSHER